MVLGNDDLFDEITMKIGQVTCKECSWLRIVMHRPNPIFLFDISRCLLDLNSNCLLATYFVIILYNPTLFEVLRFIVITLTSKCRKT